MIVSYNWLKELVKLNVPAEKLAEEMSLYSIEVESFKKLVEATNLVVGHVIEKKPHEYNISQDNSLKTSTQDNHNKQQKKIQNQRTITSEKLLIEENVQNIEQNIEINENYQQPKTNDEIIQNTNPQQSKQSNFSHTLNSGEQLSMIDLNDDLRSKHNS